MDISTHRQARPYKARRMPFPPRWYHSFPVACPFRIGHKLVDDSSCLLLQADPIQPGGQRHDLRPRAGWTGQAQNKKTRTIYTDCRPRHRHVPLWDVLPPPAALGVLPADVAGDLEVVEGHGSGSARGP